MKILGLTGGIASGKSTVARLLQEMKLPVVDADVLARRIVEPGQPALKEIAEAFGENVIQEDGQLDRKALGALIFGDAERRALLNSITHPRVAQLAQETFQQHREQGAFLLVYEVPLLFEVGLHHIVDASLLVAVSPEVQLQRLMERDQSSEEAASSRIKSQMPLEEKLKLADFVLWNNGTLDELDSELQQLWPQLLQELGISPQERSP
jgi:dephospho-CoA kinase